MSSYRGRRSVAVINAGGEVEYLDVRATIKQQLRLRAVKEAAVAKRPTIPQLYVREGSWGASGTAYPTVNRIAMTIADGCYREQVEELILHELLHVVLPSDEWHGRQFRNALIAACREWWEDLPEVRDVRNTGGIYDLDERLWRAARGARTDAVAA